VGTIKVRLHEDEREVEISPFKSRSKLIVCRNCGAPVVGERVSEQVMGKVEIDSEEFRERANLCPRCKKLESVKQLGAAIKK
jgi:hypothetical protein